MIVFIDRQHAGKPDKPEDRGATVMPAPAFGMGREAIYTGYLSLMIEERLLENGVKVIPITDGKYSDRHKRVNEYSRRFQGEKQVYLALHLNCGGPGLVRCLPKKASAEDWTKNAWYTIRGIQAPIAICCEPLFMDTHRDLLTLEHLKTIADAIATGVTRWSL